MTSRDALCLAGLSVALYLLAGCWDSRDKREAHEERAGTVHLTGQLAAWPLDLTADYSSHSDGQSSGQRLSGFAPTPGESDTLGKVMGILGLGGGLGGIGLLLRQLALNANMHRADSNEAWDTLLKVLSEKKDS